MAMFYIENPRQEVERNRLTLLSLTSEKREGGIEYSLPLCVSAVET